jgi:hypothetical protein
MLLGYPLDFKDATTLATGRSRMSPSGITSGVFSQKCHELPSVADADIISAFWDDMTCRSLVHELGHE